MSEKKLWTLEEIAELLDSKRDMIGVWKEQGLVSISRLSTDWEGMYLLRLFKKTNGGYEEMNVKSMRETIAEYLAKNVNAKRLLKDVLEKEAPDTFVDLYEKIVKEQPKVTVGVQRGSCYYLYVGGAKKGIALQLTE